MSVVPRTGANRRASALSRISIRHVFRTADGKPYAECVIRRYFAIAKAIAKITRRVRLHDLRHSFASGLASQGMTPLVLRDLLGHTTTKQTERYARPNASVADAVRAALDGTKSGQQGHRSGHPDVKESLVVLPSTKF